MTENKKFESDVIWDEIKNLPIDMFALPSQKVSDHVEKVNLPGNKLFVKLHVSSVITSLENAIGGKFDVALDDKYTIITRKEKTPAELEAFEAAEKAKNLRAKLGK